ncbi:MAG: DUF167 domain-containing protein [Sphingorhabdus sp.]
MSSSAPTRDEIAQLFNGKGEISVRVIPAAKIEKVSIENASVKIWLRTAPEDGKANKAVLTILSGLLCVPASSLEIVHGKSARDKRIRRRQD